MVGEFLEDREVDLMLEPTRQAETYSALRIDSRNNSFLFLLLCFHFIFLDMYVL